MSGGGSVVVRRQLGSKLRQLRLASGKKVTDVIEAGIASKAKMSRIEAGQGPVKMADIRALCWLYGADPATTDALAALAPGTQQEDWWEADPGVVPEWFGLYAGLESTAREIRCFEPQLVHGLLQTEEYARAVIGVLPDLAPEIIEQRVRFRMERQQRSMDGVTVIMGEGALRLVAGSPEVMAAQLESLRSSAADVRVLPFRAGPSPRRSSWALLAFEDADDPSLVYIEGDGIARYLDKPHDWAHYEQVWSILMDRAVPIGEWPT
ncbi:helix-turn-helix domain-containing protein [Pseudonocardia humida]|uniref:Helix-turn-helix domain-containing protein n=1 Tax=Pseudonocardia humida TaxID=2800819 RepID=A0ABT1A8G1_9PSEU|nr:helix-turn-helix transcriptional regulator [Pseudonocardia humida]MCO1659114.1 helix-turn-helix domain-containing protein [Pseudonocardia humida]